MRILSLLPRPVSVHLAMVCAGCLFNTFAVFLLSLKQLHENHIFLDSFLSMAISPLNNEKNLYFILVNWMG